MALSIRVLYVVMDWLPHSSVAVTVTTALQVPAVLAANVMVPRQSSVAVVAESAAASAAAVD